MADGIFGSQAKGIADYAEQMERAAEALDRINKGEQALADRGDVRAPVVRAGDLSAPATFLPPAAPGLPAGGAAGAPAAPSRSTGGSAGAAGKRIAFTQAKLYAETDFGRVQLDASWVGAHCVRSSGEIDNPFEHGKLTVGGWDCALALGMNHAFVPDPAEVVAHARTISSRSSGGGGRGGAVGASAFSDNAGPGVVSTIVATVPTGINPGTTATASSTSGMTSAQGRSLERATLDQTLVLAEILRVLKRQPPAEAPSGLRLSKDL